MLLSICQVQKGSNIVPYSQLFCYYSNMDIEQKIREYLKGVVHLSLATSKDNHPWVCEVHFACDEELNIYFRSKPERRHSIEISQNPCVAGNIVEQHDLNQKPRGVYFEGTAEKLIDVDETHPAYIAISQRLGKDPEIIEEARTEKGHKFYKISVKKFALFDSRESTPSQKYEMDWDR